jgi:hypothetical protein
MTEKVSKIIKTIAIFNIVIASIIVLCSIFLIITNDLQGSIGGIDFSPIFFLLGIFLFILSMPFLILNIFLLKGGKVAEIILGVILIIINIIITIVIFYGNLFLYLLVPFCINLVEIYFLLIKEIFTK